MFRFFSLILLFTFVSISAQERHRLRLEPLDFQTDSVDHYYTSIGQLESQDGLIHIRSMQSPRITTIDASGQVVHGFGKNGGHPSEFPGGVLAIAAGEDGVWALDTYRQRLRLFRGNEYVTGFRLNSFNVHFGVVSSNTFATGIGRVVVPAGPETGALAAVYDLNGRLIRHVGELTPFTHEHQERIAGINDSYWLRIPDGWISVHKFFPTVVRYSNRFEALREFRIESPVVEERLGKVLDFVPHGGQGNAPPVLFSDVKYHRGDLYLMSSGSLHRLDLKSGKVRDVVTFYGTGPDFSGVTRPNVRLHFFTFIDEKTLVLAHPAMMWNHDLWKVDLPFLDHPS